MERNPVRSTITWGVPGPIISAHSAILWVTWTPADGTASHRWRIDAGPRAAGSFTMPALPDALGSLWLAEGSSGTVDASVMEFTGNPTTGPYRVRLSGADLHF